MHWLGSLNVGYAIIDGRQERVLIDSGAGTNAVTPAYVKEHKMKVRPVHDLVLHPTSIPISGIVGHTAALGYIIINIQVEGIPSYYEEQVALVILNVTQLGLKVPVILGTPMIHQLCCQMKESEIQLAPEEWQHALLSYEVSRNVSIHAMTSQLDPDAGIEYPTNMGQNPIYLDKLVLLKDRVIIPAFTSQIVHVRTQKTFMKGHRLNVMVQPPYLEDKVKLPVGLYVQQVFTEMKDGSQNVLTVLRNGTGKPMHLAAGWLVGHIVAPNLVPDAVASPELEAKLAKDGEPEPLLTTEQHQELLMKVLEENGSLGKLKGRKEEMALKAKRLLMEFHHVFCLEKNKMGWTDATEHVIELLPEQDEPFKERFRRIAPHKVEEVHQHIQEMLDSGAIWPSQSPWCNNVMLVWKKDGTLRFCIDFRRLNARMKKDSYPIPKCPETMESLVGACNFSTMDLKSSFWQVKVSEDSHQYMAFTVGSMGVYKFLRMPYSLCNVPAMFQRLMQNCLGELNISFAMVYLDDMIVYSEMPEDHLTWLQAVFDHFAHNGLKLKPSKCHFFKEEITYLGHEISAKGTLPGQKGIEEIAWMGPYNVHRCQEIHRSHRVFPPFYKELHTDSQAAEWSPGLQEWQVEESPCLVDSCCWRSVLHTEEEMCHGTCIGLCRPEEVLPAGDRCI